MGKKKSSRYNRTGYDSKRQECSTTTCPMFHGRWHRELPGPDHSDAEMAKLWWRRREFRKHEKGRACLARVWGNDAGRERERGAEGMGKGNKGATGGERERERERDANELRGGPVWAWVPSLLRGCVYAFPPEVR
jgi:hypothetical protein